MHLTFGYPSQLQHLAGSPVLLMTRSSTIIVIRGLFADSGDFGTLKTSLFCTRCLHVAAMMRLSTDTLWKSIISLALLQETAHWD